MSKLGWKPWHDVVTLRDDVKSGELSLQMFAADLYDVVMKRAKPVYQDPREFFALTYPTFNLRELVKDVLRRLAGKSDQAIRQLELTYGGGKTHTLITLYHLAHEPDALPSLPAVREFIEHAGLGPSQARIAVLPFDKLDAEKGMEIGSPTNARRWLKHPWSVLAYQIAGDDGLRVLHPENAASERDSAPAENLLTALLARPAADGLATLILVDELLMFARQKVGLDPSWRGKLRDFFQALTQAVSKVDRCALVASLLATDPGRSDELGKQLTAELYAVFGRLSQQSIQPVMKDDVAEVLRRRFFTPESIGKRDTFRVPTIAAVESILSLDAAEGKTRRKAEEQRFEASYPFHPDLTDVLYTKWTQLENFQRTRGLLRTFALALRDAESWDVSPVISVEVLLASPGRTPKASISDALRELVNVAAYEEYDGRRHDWASILEEELAKAREIEGEYRALAHRELEQAVVATFLHSQPVGQRAQTPELLALVGTTRPDKIELEKALQRWAQTSWFLDEESVREAAEDGARRLPRTWRLGSRPNLTQIHHDERRGVNADDVDARLLEEIEKARWLVADANGAGARVHCLPVSPADIGEDGEFHYAVLGPQAASSPGRPSKEATRYLTEYTGPERPRANKNALVVAVPSTDGLGAAREAVRDVLAWGRVRRRLLAQDLDEVRKALLERKEREARSRVGETLRQAYCVAVTLGADGNPLALKVTPNGESLFATLAKDKRARIQETELNPEALLPDGPYDLWHEGEPERWASDLWDAFSRDPRLPKLLRPKLVVQKTLARGCQSGAFVLKASRPDRSVRTLWRQAPDQSVLDDPKLAVVLPGAATLTELDPGLLEPGKLPELWTGQSLRVGNLVTYFAGGRIVKEERAGYDEDVAIPAAPRDVVVEAVRLVVQHGRLWLIAGNVGFCAEDVPTSLVTDEAMLQTPPRPLNTLDLLPDALPAAWRDGRSNARLIAESLSEKDGRPLPWSVVAKALSEAFQAGVLKRDPVNIPWPCDAATAHAVTIVCSSDAHKSVRPTRPGQPNAARPRTWQAAFDDVSRFQDLVDHVGDLKRVVAGRPLRFHLRIEVGSSASPLPTEVVQQVHQVLMQIPLDFQDEG